MQLPKEGKIRKKKLQFTTETVELSRESNDSEI